LALAEQFTAVADLMNGNAPATSAPPKPPAPATAALKKNVELNADDDDDDLPAPGRVWDNSGPSLSELVKAQQKLAESKRTPETSNLEPVDPSDLSAVMSQLRVALQPKIVGIDGFLGDGRLIGVDDGVAVIEVPPVAARMLERNGKREVIQIE